MLPMISFLGEKWVRKERKGKHILILGGRKHQLEMEVSVIISKWE